jgi:hypothetical protein
MSVLGAISRQDRGTAPVLPNVQEPPETTGFFQNIGAGFRQSVAGPHSTQNAKAIYESRHYDQIIQALSAEGEHATDYIESPVRADSPFYRHVEGEQLQPDGRVMIPVARGFSNPFSEGPSLTRDVNPIGNFYLGGDSKEINQIWGAIQKVRQRKPGFLKEFPDQNALGALAMQQRIADQQQAQGIASRATTLGKVGSFIGGMAGSVLSGDPENFVGGGFATAPGKSVARTLVRRSIEGAGANAAAGVIAAPGQAADAQSMGQPMTGSDVARSVGENALAGAMFGTAHVVIPEGVKVVGTVANKALDTVAANVPEAIRDPVVAASIRAGTVKDRQLLHEFQRLHSPYAAVDTSTPTERAAAHVITRDVETQEQSPLQPEAVPAHSDRLSAVAHALGVDLTPPETPTTAPIQTPTVRDRSADATAPTRPASFVEGINHAEGSTRNPRSTADGYGNFLESTWLSVAPHVTDTAGLSRDQILQLRHDKTITTRATDYYAAQNSRYLRVRGLEDSPGNLSLAHFLGPADAAKVLKADPSTPVESLLQAKVVEANHEVLRGKSADEVVVWAHRRIGAAVDHLPARPDAVADEGFDYSSPVPYTIETLKPEDVTTNAALMQYKSGGDEAGITNVLKGVEQWNPLLSQQILTWEPLEGGRIVVDGHQRVGLAKRLGGDIELPSIVVREADGITAEQARVLGALRNIANGTGTLLDNAKVLRDAPNAASVLPRNAPLARDSMGLAHLSYDAFGAAVNEVVDPQIAAQVGLHARDHPEAHMPILGLLRKEKITSPGEAAAITRQALADGFGTAQSEQLSLLGNEPQQSLYKPIARIMDAAAKKLREEKRTFKVLTEKSGKIEAAGNVLDRAANESKVISNDEALAILERTAHSAGPVRDALIAAARHELSGTRRADAVSQFIDQLGSIDLRAAAAGVGPDGSFSEPSGGTGRNLAAEAPDENLPSGGQPSLFDRAVAAKTEAEKFSDPISPEAQQQAALIEHDLQHDEKPEHLFDLPSAGFRLSEEGEKPVSLKDALDEADSDEAAAKALRDCL